MDDTMVLRMVEVLSADVSWTMFRDANRAAPQLGSLVHALGCVHAGALALETFRASLETNEQAAEFDRLVELVRGRATTTAQAAILSELGKASEL